jgi:hypothetical protein
MCRSIQKAQVNCKFAGHAEMCRPNWTTQVEQGSADIAMAASVTLHLWSIEEIVSLLLAPITGKRGPYAMRFSK